MTDDAYGATIAKRRLSERLGELRLGTGYTANHVCDILNWGRGKVGRFEANQWKRPEMSDVRDLIDLSQPVGLLLTGVMMFVSDDSHPYELVRQYLDALVPGSYLSLSHLTDDQKPPARAEGFRAVFDTATEHLYFRSRPEVAAFFDGLDLVAPYEGAEPGLTFTGVWGAEDPEAADTDGSRWLYCGVARKP